MAKRSEQRSETVDNAIMAAADRICAQYADHALDADTAKAGKVLGFHAEYGLDRMCEDSWRWQTMNPQGFGS